ncbi:MAG: EAL domain-containing protein [Actinomycetota bacterium]
MHDDIAWTHRIVPLGQYVLRAACEEAATWKGPDAPVVSVNLSPRQLLDDRLISDVRDALAEHGLPPRRLVLEVTETSVMTDPDMALRRLRELRALGVGIAIDDFGTGYSSLEYLRTLPATTVKLARPFVMDLAGDPANAALASGIIDLAHALGLLVVAEGIEEIEQQLALLSMGCDLAQGYLFDRPLTAADARARLQPETTQFTDSTRFTESETPSAGGAARAARA